MKSELKRMIAERIIYLRQNKGLTMEQLAYQSGISKGGLSAIERAQRAPQIFTLAQICAGLGISIIDFFNAENFKTYTNNL